MRKYRLAVLTSHPIQYQVPLWRMLALRPEIDLTVLYGSDYGVNRPVVAEFRVPYRWDIPLLDGYHYRFLRNVAWKSSLRGFWGIVNSDLYSALKSIQPDALLLHGYARFMDWHALLLAKRLGIRVFLRGESSLLTRRRWGSRVRRFFVAKAFLNQVDAFLTIGTRNKEFYLSLGITTERMFHCPYTVDNEFFRNRVGDGKEKIRERLGLPIDRILFLGVGHLTPRKGAHDLLCAYGQMGSYKRAAMVWVGDGAERTKLERQRDSLPPDAQVIFAGFKNQSELPNYYAAADVFVLPSYEETWGLAINEAMNFALPIVTTDKVGAAIDLVNPGINGFIYPVGDVKKLTEILESLIDGECRSTLGEASLSRIKRWSMNETVEGILDALHTTIGMRYRLSTRVVDLDKPSFSCKPSDISSHHKKR